MKIQNMVVINYYYFICTEAMILEIDDQSLFLVLLLVWQKMKKIKMHDCFDLLDNIIWKIIKLLVGFKSVFTILFL